MCGINGFSFPDKKIIAAMNAAIAHRGPDDSGVYVDDAVSLGHDRLSIVDLTKAGHQPMFYEHKGRKVGIVFNGEIYNFQAIRADLEAKGYSFASHTDTEVILAAYLEYGHDCVTHFNGMWAFVIYDLAEQTLFCSRDRLGVKPFYYYHDGATFIFSSEIKGILAHEKLGLNLATNIYAPAIDYFYSLGFIPAPYTIFQSVFKLEARQNAVFDLKKGTFKTWYYFDIPEYTPEFNKPALLAEGRDLLRDAIALRLIADVPVGAFLSGGLDSSSVVGVMQSLIDVKKLHTFSIGFTGKYDETPYINEVKDYFGTQHHHAYFKDSDFSAALAKYQEIFDEPLCDFGYLPSLKVSEEARKHVTVALTGDGGDEIFGGYGSFANVQQYEQMRKVPKVLRLMVFHLVNVFKKESDWTLFGKVREVMRWSLTDTVMPLKELYPNRTYFGPASKKWYEDTSRICLEKAKNLTEASRYHSLFYLSMGDNFLTKTDRATMAYALEARSPFCDYRWVAFSARIPTAWKVNARGGTKLFMRDMIGDVVPDSITKRGKQGFTPPLYDYVKKNASDISQYVQKNLPTDMLPKEIATQLTQTDYDTPIVLDTLLRSYLLALWCKQWITKK